MDIQVLNQAEVERQKERKKEAKELEGLPKRSEGTSDDPVRMYLKEMGSVPLLTREEEVEISKRIEKAQIQIEKIIMRFRYSIREAISIASYLISAKERFDKIISEKEVADKAHFLNLLPKLCELMKSRRSASRAAPDRRARSESEKRRRALQLMENVGKVPHPRASLSAQILLPPQYHRRFRRSHSRSLRSISPARKRNSRTDSSR